MWIVKHTCFLSQLLCYFGMLPHMTYLKKQCIFWDFMSHDKSKKQCRGWDVAPHDICHKMMKTWDFA